MHITQRSPLKKLLIRLVINSPLLQVRIPKQMLLVIMSRHSARTPHEQLNNAYFTPSLSASNSSPVRMPLCCLIRDSLNPGINVPPPSRTLIEGVMSESNQGRNLFLTLSVTIVLKPVFPKYTLLIKRPHYQPILCTIEPASYVVLPQKVSDILL